MKTVTFFFTLLRLARELAEAEKSGNVEKIRKATDKHNSYRQACLASDEMSLSCARQNINY